MSIFTKISNLFSKNNSNEESSIEEVKITEEIVEPEVELQTVFNDEGTKVLEDEGVIINDESI